jgi:hypothetical protein
MKSLLLPMTLDERVGWRLQVKRGPACAQTTTILLP